MTDGGEIEIEGHAIAWGVLCNGKSLIAEGAFRHLIASGTWAPEMLWHHEPGKAAGLVSYSFADVMTTEATSADDLVCDPASSAINGTVAATWV